MTLPKPTQGELHHDGGLTSTQYWVAVSIPVIWFLIAWALWVN